MPVENNRHTIDDFEKWLHSIENQLQVAPFLCYGAGQWFRYFTELYQDTRIWENCFGVLDRNPELQGTQVLGKAIFPLEWLEQHPDHPGIILVTCKDNGEIAALLEKEDPRLIILSMQDVLAAFTEISALNDVFPIDFHLTEAPLIPKKIHFCWFGGGTLSEINEICIASWREYCPDYQIIRWDESNYDVKKHPFMAAAYEARKWAFVSDYARLDIIFREGGIYLDTDVELIRSLDDLLYQKGYMAFDYRPKSFINTGLGFGAVANNEIIKYLRDEYDSISFDYPNRKIRTFACPEIQTKALEKIGLNRDGRLQTINGFSFYPTKVLSGMNPYSMRSNCLPETFSLHHYVGSWL